MQPSEGGSYIRDKKTGELKRVGREPAHAKPAAIAAPRKEAAGDAAEAPKETGK